MTQYGRTIAEIDLDALEFNIKEIRKRVPEGVRILGTLKANAYGHGAKEVHRVLKENGVDIFSVATVEEGVWLREQGIQDDLLLLGYVSEVDAPLLVKYDIIAAAPSLSVGQMLAEEGKRQNKQARVHLKVDTGMGRIGFFPTEEAVEEMAQMASLPNLSVEGIFTHFAKSDAADKGYTKMQKERFFFVVEALKERGIRPAICHCANSAAVMDFDDLFLDMVRPGIILYGLYPSDEVKKENLPLRPVLSWKSQISFLKEVPAETAISYGCTYVTKEKRNIATVPVGYADGYSRSLSNRGQVLIAGKRAPIVGRICMDQMMVDVTDLPPISVGDEVVLLGKSGAEEISTDEIAGWLGTISYEVTCLIAHRVPRWYKKDGKFCGIQHMSEEKGFFPQEV